MDNDFILLKKVKKVYKDIKFKLNYKDKYIHSALSGNTEIYNLMQSDRSIMIARCGATEMRCVAEYLKGNFSDRIKKEIQELSGVFPTTDEFLRKFCNYYIDCVANSDILALWGVGAESEVVHKYCKSTEFTKLEALEPYYFDAPWSSVLKNKKVLIIHPFKNSIESQYKRYDKLFENLDVLPQFKSLTCIKAVQSIAGEETEFVTWFDALDYMCREIDEVDFDIAIIGAGAYGLPLTSYVKSIGKKAIQMAGATQILFGIKGRRWDSYQPISKLYNESWIRPALDETPKQKFKVEGGSYW